MSFVQASCILCSQEAERAKSSGEAAYEGARTQQEADAAQLVIKKSVADLKAAKCKSKPPEPELEQISRDVVYFKVCC